MDARSLWHKCKSLLYKGIPYVLVAAFTAATVMMVLGVRNNRHLYEDVGNTKTELENHQQQLQGTLTQTKELLERLRTIEGDTLLLMQQTDAEKTEVSVEAAAVN